MYLSVFDFQTLYTYPENFRAYKAQIAAQYSKADLKIVSSPPDFKFGETNKTPEFLKKFPLGKVNNALNYLKILEHHYFDTCQIFVDLTFIKCVVCISSYV